MTATHDLKYMVHAIQLAQRGLYSTDPNPRVGCVIVRDGVIVGEGWHQQAGGPHAEIVALDDAGEQAKGADVYVTLEPCSHHGRTPPCIDALVRAGVSRVMMAMEDPNPLVSGAGRQALIQAGVEVSVGACRDMATALNPGFILRMTKQRPFVRCKLAMSMDGRTAMASGESKWITGDAARRDVQHLRARSSAILTGVGTVLADDPAMTVRPPGEADPKSELRQPLRVIVDSQLRTSIQATIFQQPGETLLATILAEDKAQRFTAIPKVSSVQLPAQNDRVDLSALLIYLAEREINEVLLEAGSTLCGAMLQAELIDELVIYMAPHLMGDQARGLFSLLGLDAIAERISLDIKDIRAVGDDWRITATIKKQLSVTSA